MVGQKRETWYLLLAAGLLFLSGRLVLRHVLAGSLEDSVDGFCAGLGTALVIGALVKAKRDQKAKGA